MHDHEAWALADRRGSKSAASSLQRKACSEKPAASSKKPTASSQQLYDEDDDDDDNDHDDACVRAYACLCLHRLSWFLDFFVANLLLPTPRNLRSNTCKNDGSV